MDWVLSCADEYVLTPYVYPAYVPEDNMLRQLASLFVIVSLSAIVMYFIMAGFSYVFIFDKELRKHKKFLPDQEKLEIQAFLGSVPGMSLLTCIMFLAEVRGYSRLYDDAGMYGGAPFMALSFFTFLFFTDMCIYWIHRGLHHRRFKHLHKLHHKWIIPTPFASHAFHPIDGFAQSFPYHVYPFLFPLHKGVYLGLFVFVNIWTVMIHDGDYRLPGPLQHVINGSAHHSDHHTAYNYNYGQYFTLWDRLGGSYRHPSALYGKGIHDEVREQLAKSGHTATPLSAGKSAAHLNGVHASANNKKMI